MNRREQLGQLFSANPLFGAWIVSLLLGTGMFVANTARIHAQEIVIPCPPNCLQIEYDSFWWYVECWPLPPKCSLNGGAASTQTTATTTVKPVKPVVRVR